MNEMKQILKVMFDKHGANAVLDALCEVCRDKAEHLAVEWQDTTQAKKWESLAAAIDPEGLAQWL